MPIPYRSIVRTSSSGHAAGRMSRATFRRVYRWWNASSRSLRHLLTLDLSRPTLRRHRDNLWVLGGEIIRRLQMDSDLRKQPIEQVVGDLIDDEGGPLLSHGRARGRAARLRCDMPKVFALPGRRSRAARSPAQNASTNDEPSEPLTAPMQTARPRGSRSSPAAARPVRRKAQGFTASRVDEARYSCADRCGDPTDLLHRRTTPPRYVRPNRLPITHKFSPGTEIFAPEPFLRPAITLSDYSLCIGVSGHSLRRDRSMIVCGLPPPSMSSYAHGTRIYLQGSQTLALSVVCPTTDGPVPSTSSASPGQRTMLPARPRHPTLSHAPDFRQTMLKYAAAAQHRVQSGVRDIATAKTCQCTDMRSSRQHGSYRPGTTPGGRGSRIQRGSSPACSG